MFLYSEVKYENPLFFPLYPVLPTARFNLPTRSFNLLKPTGHVMHQQV